MHPISLFMTLMLIERSLRPGCRSSGINVEEFIRCGVVSGMRQLLEFGLFHGDPHPGNIFCLEVGAGLVRCCSVQLTLVRCQPRFFCFQHRGKAI